MNSHLSLPISLYLDRPRQCCAAVHSLSEYSRAKVALRYLNHHPAYYTLSRAIPRRITSYYLTSQLSSPLTTIQSSATALTNSSYRPSTHQATTPSQLNTSEMPPPINPTSTRWQLTWKPQPPPVIELPPGVTRSFIETPNGKLELLSALPQKSIPYPTSGVPPFTTAPASPNPQHQTPAFKNPILFVHGGFGCAVIFVPWMLHLTSHGYRCHAISVRGHGQSWDPGYLKMVFATSATSLAEDVAAGVAYLEGRFWETGADKTKVKHVKDGYRGEVILCGHSSGGGLVQMVCDQELAKVKALVLLAGTPSFGAYVSLLPPPHFNITLTPLQCQFKFTSWSPHFDLISISPQPYI